MERFLFLLFQKEYMYGFATLLDDTANWLTEMGMTWKPLTGIVGYTYPRWTSPAQGYEGQGYFNLFKETIEKNKYPVEIMTETPGEELIVEVKKYIKDHSNITICFSTLNYVSIRYVTTVFTGCRKGVSCYREREIMLFVVL